MNHKLKEISYMHAEGYAAGEMKHDLHPIYNPLELLLTGGCPFFRMSL